MSKNKSWDDLLALALFAFATIDRKCEAFIASENFKAIQEASKKAMTAARDGISLGNDLLDRSRFHR